MEQFETNPRSWLRWAQDNDVDRYEAAERAGKLKTGAARIETFEWSQEASLLNRVVLELAHLSHITAVKGTKDQKKKFKAPKLSWPFTAVDGLKERVRAVRSKRQKAFWAMFEYQPQDEWEREMAEHQAALEAGAPSPVQERVFAEARERSRPDGAGVPSARSDA